MNAYTTFSYIYYDVVYLFFAVVSWLIVALVAKSPWKHHRKWAMSGAIGNTCFGCSRITYGLHHFGHLGTRMQIDMIGAAFWLTGSIIGLYGLWMFYAVIKQSLQSAPGRDLFTQGYGEHEPGVWPPPPRVGP